MPAELDAVVVAAWRASGISTQLFRKTSCGVAYTRSAPDYNGHRGVRETCDICRGRSGSGRVLGRSERGKPSGPGDQPGPSGSSAAELMKLGWRVPPGLTWRV
jgi:hypothetical protein